jgi:hypothetical protein
MNSKSRPTCAARKIFPIVRNRPAGTRHGPQGRCTRLRRFCERPPPERGSGKGKGERASPPIPDFAPSAAGRTAAGTSPPATRGAFPPRPARASAWAAPEGFPGKDYTPAQEEDNSVGPTISGILEISAQGAVEAKIRKERIPAPFHHLRRQGVPEFPEGFQSGPGSLPSLPGEVSLHRARGPPAEPGPSRMRLRAA